MVLLRLSVNVYPREQLPSSSSFSIRSFLGDRENNGQSSSSSAAVKPAGFLVILHDPEDATLGGLAAIIHEKWRKLRPNADPLEIKKLVDDVRPSVDLDPDMTVADVWVDKGKARAEGHDQHAAVRVVQKPAPHAPVRFPSVEQDWDAAARAYEIQKQRQKAASVHKFPPIPEEPSRSSFADNHVAVERVENSQPEASRPKQIVKGPSGLVEREDQPLSSVERDEVFAPQSRLNGASSQIWSDAPSDSGNLAPAHAPGRRMESQELGDFPGPAVPKPQAAVRESVAEESESESGSEYETGSEESSEESSDDSSEGGESEETGVPQDGRDIKGVKHSEDGEESDGSEETGPSESDESDESDEDENNTDVPMTDNAAASNQALPPTNPPREVEIPSSNAPEKESHVEDDHVRDRDVPMNDNAGVEEQTLASTDPTREAEIPSLLAPEKETQNENHHVQDGDIPMTNNMADEQALPSVQQTREEEVPSSSALEKDSQNDATPPMKLRSRKRKNSDHGVEPNKEPRLAPASSPILQNGKNGSHVAEDDGTTPPSSTWNGFSRTDREFDHESNGDGQSVEQGLLEPADPPPRKMSKIVKLPLPKASDKRTVPGAGEPAYTRPEHAMSPPAPGHQSPQPTSSQPLSQSTSAAKDQNGAAETPKSTPSAFRRDTLNGKSERRSVSFADTQAPKSDPQPKSTPLRANVPSISSPPTSQLPASQQRNVSIGSMVYPPGVTPEMVSKITKEAEEKHAKQDQQTAEYKRKIKAAKEQYPDSEYLRQLREVCKVWESLLAAERGRKSVSSVKRLRIRHADETRRLEMTEACIKPTLFKPHDSPEPNAAPKTAASREEAGRPERATTVATRNLRGDSATPNKPVSKASPSGATPLGRTRSQNARQSSINPGGQATTNQAKSLTSPETKKPDGTKGRPLKLESDSEYEQEESESDSESESESESENTDLEILKVMPSSQPVGKPASSNPWSRTPPSINPRTSLKSLLDDQKSNQAVRQSTQPTNLSTTRKSVFSPSPHGADDSDDDDESESDSDSNSDEGDITSSGHVQRLRRARPKA